MGIYRRIEVHTWVDEKFKKLTPIQPSGQALWFYLLTGPQTGIIPGLFKAGHAAMAEDLEWDIEAFEEAFREVLREGLAKDSTKDRLVWIPNAIKYNPPSSPNVIRSWGAALDTLPECKLREEAIEYMRKEIYLLDKKEVKGFAKAFDEVFGKGFGEGLPKGNANQSPNQEQKQEQKQKQYQNQNNKKEREAAAAPPSPPPHSFENQDDEEDVSQVFGTFKLVKLKTSSYFDLLSRYGQSVTDDYVGRLDRHMKSTGKTYIDHHAVIIDWLIRDKVSEVGVWSSGSPPVPDSDRVSPEAVVAITMGARAKLKIPVKT